jgi:hypothetical protein
MMSLTQGKAASTFGGWGSTLGLGSPTQEEPAPPAKAETQQEPAQEPEPAADEWGLPVTTKGVSTSTSHMCLLRL